MQISKLNVKTVMDIYIHTCSGRGVRGQASYKQKKDKLRYNRYFLTKRKSHAIELILFLWH